MSDRNGESLRSARRMKVFQPVELSRDGQEQRAHILDLSLTGARVHVEDPPRRGTVLTLKIDTRSRRAIVVWQRGPQLGVAFLLPFGQPEIDAIVAAPPHAAGAPR